jgi:hypothetical protein
MNRYTNLYRGHDSTLRWEKILPFATIQVDLEIIKFSEPTQTWKEKYYMISSIYGIFKKYG